MDLCQPHPGQSQTHVPSGSLWLSAKLQITHNHPYPKHDVACRYLRQCSLSTSTGVHYLDECASTSTQHECRGFRRSVQSPALVQLQRWHHLVLNVRCNECHYDRYHGLLATTTDPSLFRATPDQRRSGASEDLCGRHREPACNDRLVNDRRKRFD